MPPKPGSYRESFRTNRTTRREYGAMMPSGFSELAFLGDPLEGLRRVPDPILVVVTVCRKQAYHFVGSARGRAGDIACGEIDSLSNAILVLQRLAPSRITRLLGPTTSTAWPAIRIPDEAGFGQTNQRPNKRKIPIVFSYIRAKPAPTGVANSGARSLPCRLWKHEIAMAERA